MIPDSQTLIEAITNSSSKNFNHGGGGALLALKTELEIHIHTRNLGKVRGNLPQMSYGLHFHIQKYFNTNRNFPIPLWGVLVFQKYQKYK